MIGHTNNRPRSLRAVSLLLAAVALTGCASMSTEMRAEEATYQVLNATSAVLTDQNIHHSACQCATETGQWKAVIGELPSTTQIYAMAAVTGAAHFAVSRWLSDIDAPRWVQRSWQVLTIGAAGISVSRGFGLRRDLNHSSPPPDTNNLDMRPVMDTQPVTCTTTSCL